MGTNEFSEKSKKESEERRARFLELLRGDPTKGRAPQSIRSACIAVGVNRNTVKTWKDKYPEFAEEFVDAMEDGTDTMEDEAVRRAVTGIPKGVYHQGEKVAEETVYSDSLLTCILAGRRPERYGRSTNIQVNNQTNVSAPPSSEQVARALALLLAEAQASKERQKKLEGQNAS